MRYTVIIQADSLTLEQRRSITKAILNDENGDVVEFAKVMQVRPSKSKLDLGLRYNDRP